MTELPLTIGIVGSRRGVDLAAVRAYTKQVFTKHPTAALVSGGAVGVDLTAESVAKEMGKAWLSIRPDGPHMYDRGNGRAEKLWRVVMVGEPDPEIPDPWAFGCYASFGQAAFARNTFIAQGADIVVAFTTGSKGTANTISEAARFGRRVFIHGPDGSPVRLRTGVCRSCKATVVFVPTPAGKLIPLDAMPSSEGNMVMRSDVAIQTKEPREGERVYMPHHATCPDAARYRR